MSVRSRIGSAPAAPYALVFALLLALYTLTSGGHTSSNDDEEMYYLTQGMVDHGSLALPPAEGKALFAGLGSDGKYYASSSHGIVTSVLAVPFYALGEGAAKLFDPRYRDFITRGAVTAVSALSTAAAAVALSVIAVDLGAAPAAAIGLGALFGLCTIAWPYSKYFWGEPVAGLMLLLAVLAAIRAHRRNSLRDWALSSAFTILAASARPAMLPAFGVLGVYALASGWDRRRISRSRLRAAALGFGGPVAVGLVAVGAYSLAGALLGKPGAWVAGLAATIWAVGTHAFRSDVWPGLYGLLLSPGKSVFLYSPPLIFGAAAVPALWRKAPREALLFLGLFAFQTYLMGRLSVWPGDSAWGPRYLVPFTPYLVLPLAAWFRPDYEMRSWQRWGVAAMAGLGLVVQLFAVATNYDTYVLETGGPSGLGAEQRWYDPAASPLLAAPRQLAGRIQLYLGSIQPGEFALAGGFYPGERPDNQLPRWSNGQGAIRFVAPKAGEGRLVLDVVQPDHGRPRSVPQLGLGLDGRPPVLPKQVLQRSPGQYEISFDLGEVRAGQHTLSLLSPTYVPAMTGDGADDRTLGVQLADVRLKVGSQTFRQVEWPIVPPLPVSDRNTWSRTAFGWFYDPRDDQLVDVWPWYVAHSGLPPILALLAVIPLAAAIRVGWQLTAWFRRSGEPRRAGAGAATLSWRMPSLSGLTALAIVVTAALQARGEISTKLPFPTDPLLSVSPLASQAMLSKSVPIQGYALDRNAPAGVGVNAVGLYFGSASTSKLLTTAAPGLPRPDVARDMGARFGNSGWSYSLDVSGYAPGRYSLTAVAAGGNATRVSESTLPINVLKPGEFAFGNGFYDSENASGGPVPRWTSGDGAIDLYPAAPGQLNVEMVVQKPRFGPQQILLLLPDVRFLWDGKPTLPGRLSARPLPNDTYAVQLSLDLPGKPQRHELELVSSTFVPSETEKGSSDSRHLGARVREFAVQSAGGPLVELGQRITGLLNQ